MQNLILVTYASRTGSTKEVAGAIGKILAEEDSKVDILPMHQVSGLERYQAVVAGSAIQNRQWLPEAMDFVKNYHSDLSKNQTAIFSLCMTLAMRNGENYRREAGLYQFH